MLPKLFWNMELKKTQCGSNSPTEMKLLETNLKVYSMNFLKLSKLNCLNTLNNKSYSFYISKKL